MKWPQYIVLCWIFVELGYKFALNGQPRTGEYSGVASLIVYGLLVWLLYMGGFFKGGQ